MNANIQEWIDENIVFVMTRQHAYSPEFYTDGGVAIGQEEDNHLNQMDNEVSVWCECCDDTIATCQESSDLTEIVVNHINSCHQEIT